jgi:hypothetical protein
MIISAEKKHIPFVPIVITLVVLIALGAGGFYVWNKYLRTSTTTATYATAPSGTYLVLKDWGVEFAIPKGMSTILQYELNASPNNEGIVTYYEFSTQRVEALGGQCGASDPVLGVVRLALLDRTRTQIENDSSGGVATNNNKPLNGYYYYASSAQSTCSNNGIDQQLQDRSALYKMLLQPIALAT